MWTPTQITALIVALAVPQYVSAQGQIVELPDGELIVSDVTTVASTVAATSTVAANAKFKAPSTTPSPTPSSTPPPPANQAPAPSASPSVATGVTHVAVSAPISSAIASEKSQGNTLGVASKPASAVVTANPSPVGNGVMTWAITNKWPDPLSISYLNNAGSPSAVGSPGPAPLGSTTNVVFPTGWAGRVYVGKTTNSADTLIEGSTTNANDIDVSYVDGYSVPVTCSVNGVAITGCNIDLWSVSGKCADEVGDKQVCLNPMQTVADGPATPWFQPCQGAAYTFPNDNIANNGNTGSPLVSCCIGSAAQGCTLAPDRQGKGNNKPSKKRSLSTPEQPLEAEDAATNEIKARSPSLLPHSHSHMKKHLRKAHGARMVHDVKDVL